MNNQWQKKAKQAQKETDAALSNQIAQLSNIKQQEINQL